MEVFFGNLYYATSRLLGASLHVSVVLRATEEAIGPSHCQ